ncbi:hypothetical protein [Streptomyces sp. NPDC058385]|uniref:hypothetical protein n=1 Tax=Streptomyces sp. NPDC058385 TaxID=3346473 RepID=UPI003669F7DE
MTDALVAEGNHGTAGLDIRATTSEADVTARSLWRCYVRAGVTGLKWESHPGDGHVSRREMSTATSTSTSTSAPPQRVVGRHNMAGGFAAPAMFEGRSG